MVLSNLSKLLTPETLFRIGYMAQIYGLPFQHDTSLYYYGKEILWETWKHNRALKWRKKLILTVELIGMREWWWRRPSPYTTKAGFPVWLVASTSIVRYIDNQKYIRRRFSRWLKLQVNLGYTWLGEWNKRFSSCEQRTCLVEWSPANFFEVRKSTVSNAIWDSSFKPFLKDIF
jgi:hypothetical protein